MGLSLIWLQAVAAFNLVCTGNSVSGRIDDFKTFEAKSPFKREIRVDLERMRWCDDECTATRPIKSFTETGIVFDLKEEAGLETWHMVNRESGSYILRVRGSEINYVRMDTGSCERAPFTGFPTRKF
ncbi:hypothetical protein [Sphingomonas sp.]|uniref:hypothetical protein n=1 Tax=Sphingomonas sp. TaxID=28214 RepID=UPI0028A8162C|nr:hypothetical protein [Sphingomonas sp.]